ncbi:hypothetical protein LBMAG43_08540 [Methylococcaceae bacterium]|nr:hypothetical protein LBMAG43_08540 [Methylococcaceae bacterium]
MAEETLSQRMAQFSAVKLALLAEQLSQQREIIQSEPIAVIGLGCRFPGGIDSPESYWQALCDGLETMEEVPADHWDSQTYFSAEPNQVGKISSPCGGYLKNVYDFDPQFFNISPREALSLDPQHRLLLEVAWEALENAGQSSEELFNSPSGVFVGVGAFDHGLRLLGGDETAIDAYYGTGNAFSAAAGRLSYTLGFTGPSMAIDTACSSSLTAVHLACQSLKQRECRLALAGGVNLMLLAENFVALSQAGMLSSDGHCKTFDAAANGYVRGEGCGMVVLKRLSDALADKDTVLAVIRGSAVNQDGASAGLTVPNGISQQAVIEQALANAKVPPDLIHYVEAHGTGTPLGDPIEINALATVFAASHSVENPLLVGSVKTNIGHLESAAGVAGLIKLVLSLQHQQIPKQLHFQTPNPHIEWQDLPIKVVNAPITWLRGEKRRLAGVSAFGFSGMNAHVIVEESPMVVENTSAFEPCYLLPISAKSEAALKALQQRYVDYFSRNPNVNYANVCYTAAVGRQHFPCRSMLPAKTVSQAIQQLQTLLKGDQVIFEDANSVEARYLAGEKIDWAAVHNHQKLPKIVLPTYPFQRQSYWLATTKSDTKTLNSGHPLLGVKIPSASKIVQFQTLFTLEQPIWLADHRLPPHVVFPATGYIELALAAGEKLFNTTRLEIQNFDIRQALIVDSKTLVQIILEPIERDYKFTIFSCIESLLHEEKWTLHAEGLLGLNAEKPLLNPLVKAEFSETLAANIEAFYDNYQQQGLDYGESFQGVRNFTVENQTVSGSIVLTTHSKNYVLHPALLDGCLQLLKATLPAENTQRYLPIGLERLTLYRAGIEAVFCRATFVDRGDYYQANLQIFDRNGQTVAAIEKLTLRTVSAEQLQPKKLLDSYEIKWQKQPLEVVNEQNLSGENWLIFVEPGILAAQFETALPNAILVKSGKSFQKMDTKNVQINPMESSNYDTLLTDYPSLDGIIHAWSENFVEFGDVKKADTFIEQVQKHSCGSVLLLVQALKRAELSPSLTLITRGAQAVYQNAMPAQKSLNLLQAPLLGLAKVIVLEQPELHCLRLDLNPDESTNDDAKIIVQELQNRIIAEDQIAYRHEQRYVPRLHKRKNVSISKKPRRLQLNDYGIDQLQLVETTFKKPGSGQVQIRVTASGLNFKDVLHGLGMLKEPNFSAQTLPFGFECAGIVEHVGDGCDFHIGERVMAVLTPSSMADFVNVDARYVIKTPAGLSDSDAAAIPLAYLTASYGLESLAKAKMGESILIHAAAGGVGQAAIQIAQFHGLEIFATAHPDKWDMLQNQGIQHIYHSRHANYADQILAKTNGKGVDIVLNSLTGDFIDENLRCLTQNGRFIEIGKLGIRTPEDMQHKRPDLDYQVFELGDIGEKQPELIQVLFKNLGERLQTQTLKPLPVQLYPLERASEAFHCMAKAQHRGKIVLTHTAGQILPQRTYLITGGLGGLGLKFAEWLISQGATHLVLNSLHVTNSETHTQIEQFNKTATVEVFVANIGQLSDVQNLFTHIQNTLPPLAGIIHAAGKIDDGMLQKLDWARFESVAQPKINGSWYLHRCSEHLPLDFFVEFSSATALLGAPGQGNYAAANAFQDALAHYRKLKNLPALSINWGPWGEIGMLKDLQVQDQQRVLKLGWQQIELQQGLALFESLLPQTVTQIGALDLNWMQYWKNSLTAITPEFLSDLKAQTASQLVAIKTESFIEQLTALNLSERHSALQDYLHDKVKSVLGLKTTILKRHRFFDLGLDSLMSVELKNRLEHDLKKTLSSTLVFDYPTLEDLHGHITQDVIPELFIKDKNQFMDGDITELLARELAELIGK